MREANHTAIRPSSIVRQLSLIGKRLRVGRQEDAHEFMRLLLDCFHRSELRILGLKESGPRALVDNTFVQHVFGGYFRNQLKCVCAVYRSAVASYLRAALVH